MFILKDAEKSMGSGKKTVYKQIGNLKRIGNFARSSCKNSRVFHE